MSNANVGSLVKALGWDSGAVVDRQKMTRWVIQDFIAANSVAWIYGAPGSYKTFAALDMAMSVATGRPWQGREVEQGSVLYIAAEGGDDIHIRRAAWVARHRRDGLLRIADSRPQIDSQLEDDYSEPGSTIRRSGYGQLSEALAPVVRIKEGLEGELKQIASKLLNAESALKLNKDEVGGYVEKGRKAPQFLVDREQESALVVRDLQSKRDRLEESLEYFNDPTVSEAAKPRLVVIDTFSATASDDTKDAVNRYTRNLYRALRQAIPDAGFLVIDHTTKGGDTWMGSQAKLGNVDMMAEASAKGDILTLSMQGGRGKIKGAPPFEDIHLKMVSQGIGREDAYGRELQSLVCTDGTKAKRLAELADGDSAGAILLEQVQEAGELARDELRELFGSHKSNASKKPDTVGRAFRRALKSLVEDGLIVEGNGLLRVPD